MKFILVLLLTLASQPVFAHNYVIRPEKGLCILPSVMQCYPVAKLDKKSTEVHCFKGGVNEFAIIRNEHGQRMAPRELVNFPITFLETKMMMMQNGFREEVDFYKTCQLEIYYPKKK